MSDLLTVPEAKRAPRLHITSAGLRTALREHLPAKEYALMWEVSDAAGFARSRSADAIAMSLWPSRGLQLMGFEIKVSRSDWLNELRNPAKADKIANYCDRWIVLTPAGLIPPSELPPLWGLWEFDGRAVRCAVTPKPIEAAPMNRSFLAALLRRADETNAALIAAGITKEREVERAKWNERVETEVRERMHRYEALKRDVEQFETASGVKIKDEWRYGEIGKAVKVVMENGDSVFDDARRLRDRLNALLDAPAAA